MSHSRKFCAHLGTWSMRRVAMRAKMIRPRATIQLTTIELVIGNPKTWPISTAFCDKPCSSGVEIAGDGTWLEALIAGAACAFESSANVGDALRTINTAIK